MGNGQWVHAEASWNMLLLPPPSLSDGRRQVSPDPQGNRAARRAAKRRGMKPRVYPHELRTDILHNGETNLG